MNARALVVVGHPAQDSFCHALALAVREAWEQEGLEVAWRDLAATNFDPRLTPEEARGLPSRDPGVLADQRLLAEADLLAFIHPNCWGAPPALMKGFIDRVFAPGAAYAFAKGSDDGTAPFGLLRAAGALVLNTGNTEAERERTVFGDPLQRQWIDCLLSYCGVRRTERHLFAVVATSDAEQRRSWISQAASAASGLARSIAPTP